MANLTWQGQPLLPPPPSGDDDQVLNIQKYLHGRFGPTYAPTPHPSYQDELVLAYPGIYFGFAKSDEKQQEPPLRRVLIAAKTEDSERPPPFPDVLQSSNALKDTGTLPGELDMIDVFASLRQLFIFSYS